jgi:hypothetical protein
MKRRLFNLAAAVSLVMMLAITVLWMRSYVWQAYVTSDWGPRGETRLFAHINRGTGFFGFHRHGPQKVLLPFYWSLSEIPTTFSPSGEGFGTVHFSRFGFRLWTGRDYGRFYVNVFIPMWFASLALSILPAVRLSARLRQSSVDEGLCQNCGYDLRATPERCPECGTPAAEGGLP